MTDNPDETGETPKRQPASKEEARRQRQQALAELAQSRRPDMESPPSASTHASAWNGRHPPQSPRRRWRVALAFVLVAAVLGAVGYSVLPGPQHPAGPTGHPRVIDLIQDGLACPQDVAWSPDGATVAVLGYHQNCPTSALPDYAYAPGQLDTYSATTGAPIAKIQPDDAIAQALQLAPPLGATPVTRSADVSHQIIQYEHVLWSPNGKQLAISFSVNGNTTPYTNGVLLTDAAGTSKTARILTYTSSPSIRYSGEWNVKTGAYISIPASADPASWQPVPPALSYVWGTDGTLAANGALLSLTGIPPAPAPGPIGTPDGGSSFTIWQPAAITPVADMTNSSGTSGNAPSVYSYYTNFSAWSPDGSRLILDISVFDLFATDPGHLPSAGDLASQRIAATALLRMRDKGIAQGIADVLHSRPGSDTDPIPLLWRPDGQVVAVPFQPTVTPGDPASNTAATLSGVRLYNCATGRLLATLREPVQPEGLSPGLIYVRWSPDGAHLLLLDSAYNALTIWGPGQLPRS